MLVDALPTPHSNTLRLTNTVYPPSHPHLHFFKNTQLSPINEVTVHMGVGQSTQYEQPVDTPQKKSNFLLSTAINCQ